MSQLEKEQGLEKQKGILALKEELEQQVKDYQRIVEHYRKRSVEKYGHQEVFYNGKMEATKIIVGKLEELLK